MSWVKFLCLAFWQAWSHLVSLNVAWGQVYLRDRCRCSSPVCRRRDVTPHACLGSTDHSQPRAGASGAWAAQDVGASA